MTGVPSPDPVAKVLFRCDGCGATAPGVFGADCAAHKPALWFARRDDDGPQFACSRACIDRVSAASGKTRVVLPF